MSLYDAFISYSHAKDKPVAAAMQAVIQKLGKPWYRRRMLRVFRDDTSLAATPELWPTLEKTLDQSRFIILLASPQFARSKWCGMEVAHWLQHKSLETLLIAVTDGELQWDEAAGDFAWDEATPLPSLLKGHFRNEPKWIDLRAWRDAPDSRDPKFVDAAADLAAAVHGLPKEDLLSQEVLQQKRALRLAWSAAASLTLLAGSAGWQWWEAENAKRAAQTAEKIATEQRDLAERNLGIARKAADDLVFKIAQGLRGVEGMRVESVRQILETAQGVMDQLVRSAPDDLRLRRSRYAMLFEFAVTYERVGDLSRAQAMAEESLAIARQLATVDEQNTEWRRDLIVGLVKVGDIQRTKGNAREALAAYEQGVSELRKLAVRRILDASALGDLTIVLDKVGRVRRSLDDKAGAFASFQESIAITRKLLAAEPRSVKWREKLASALSDIGGLFEDDKDWKRAGEVYEESMAIRRAIGAEDPRNLENQHNIVVGLQKIASIRRNARNSAGAAAAYEEALSIMRRLVAADPGNASWQRAFGVALFQVGDARVSTRDRKGALALYHEALAVRRKLAVADPRNARWQLDMVTALFRAGTLSTPNEARRLYQEALAIAEQLVKDERVPAVQRQWPSILREHLAKLPSLPQAESAAEGPSAPPVAASP